MKKKKDMKKLALMGMAAGMLLSNQNAEASFGGNNNNDNSLYLAAKCGANKCGGTVAAGCGGKNKCGGTVAAGCQAHGGCNQVAERTPYSGYYYQNSCNGYQPSQSSCNGYQPSHNSCRSSSQGYYDPSQWATNDQSGQNQANKPGSTQGQQGKYADNDQSKPKNAGQQGTQGQQSKAYQASNGCGSPHGCNGGPDQKPSGMSKYQASGCGASNRPSNAGNSSNYYNPNQLAEADTKVAPAKLNESDLLSKLNAQGKATYNGLTPEGKKLALQLANADCKGKNECKGLNSCKTNKNECAGKGGCKGQSNCSFKDKNLAVKVAAQKMAEKRNGLQNK